MCDLNYITFYKMKIMEISDRQRLKGGGRVNTDFF